jgi:hypothetical protein
MKTAKQWVDENSQSGPFDTVGNCKDAEALVLAIQDGVANDDNRDCLVVRLRELMEQWRCTAKLLRLIDVDGAAAHLECADELGQILDGDLSPIAKWTDLPCIEKETSDGTN